MSWETDKELESNSRFYKFAEGMNKVVLSSDGDKVRDSYGNAVVEFQTVEGKLLSVKPSPMLDALRAAKKKFGTLVNRSLFVTRTGTNFENTKYTDIKVE